MTCSTRIWSNFATKGPIMHLKMAKTCPEVANVCNFWTHFAIFGYLRGLLVTMSAQILVEEILSFEMSIQTSKSDKN